MQDTRAKDTASDQPLRIALLRQRYTPFGGAERFVDRALRALGADRVEVTLITRRWSGDSPFEVRVCDPFYWGRRWRDAAFARAACRYLDDVHYDLVQSHERIACCDVYRAGDGVHRTWLAQRGRVLSPIRRLGLGLNPYHRYVLAAEERLFKSSRLRAVICNSNMVREDIQRRFGLSRDKLPVIYNGVDTTAYHPGLRDRFRADLRRRLGISGAATVFLFVGSGFERKGLAAALRAFSRISGATHLVVVGKDKREKRYQSMASDLGIADRVTFGGAQRDVTPFYGAADVLVLPTLYDPFPNVVVEAMAAGLPVITSTQCGAAEIIGSGVSGFVHDALDTLSLGQSMAVLCDPARARAMGKAARDTAEPLTLERMSQKLIDLYRQLLLGNR